jgi:hypothetical protein
LDAREGRAPYSGRANCEKAALKLDVSSGVLDAREGRAPYSGRANCEKAALKLDVSSGVRRSEDLQCCGVISVVAEFMVRWYVSVGVRRSGGLQCLDAIHSVNWYGKWTTERNAIGHTPARASSEQVWEPMNPRVQIYAKNAHRTRTGPLCKAWLPVSLWHLQDTQE